MARAAIPWLLCLAACADPVGHGSGAIVGGQATNSDPAVVGITNGDVLHCTGTLVTRRHVVTAAHCVPPHLEFITSMDRLQIFFGTDIGSEGLFVPVEAGAAGPWSSEDVPGDIAILVMERQVNVEPIPLASTWTPAADETIRLVGFGQNVDTQVPGQGGDGLKREGVATVDGEVGSGIDLNPGPETICSGDSGGPGLAMEGETEVLAMVHSRGDCESSSYHELVSPWMSNLLEPFMASHPEGGCGDDGVCAVGCEEADPDCECLADGHCYNCERGWWWDPDCPSECGPDGTCMPEGCAVPDPDCGSCEEDGTCNAECSADPDCDAGANTDGGGGCQSTHSPIAPMGLGLVFLWFVAGRRRRGLGRR